MKNGFPKLKSDTWVIIGAVGGGAAFIVTVIVSVMLALHSTTNARIDAQGERIDMLYDTMREEHIALRDEHVALRDEHVAMRNEHALILESLAGVAQRVSYIEGHLGVGRMVDGESAELP